jgi:hypothetical protein
VSRAASVRALVLAARRRWLAARWCESALTGGAAAGLALACAVWSGASLRAPGSIAAGALCAALAALTLAGERRRSPRELARRLDRRLGEGGALLTAFELELEGRGEGVAGLHLARTRARLDRRRLLAAVSPPSAAFLAALALGAALAALAGERAGGGRGHAGAAQPAAGAALARLGALAEQPTSASEQELAEALARLEALADLAEVPRDAREQAQRALGTLLEQGALAPTLERRARALSERLGGSDAAATGVAASGSRELALAGEPPERTMSGPPEESHVLEPPPTSPAPAPAGRWWPRRHDAVVAGYLERTRATAEGGR